MSKRTVKDRILDALKGTGLSFKDTEMEKAAEKVADAVEENSGAGGGDTHVHLHTGPDGEKVDDAAYCTKDDFEAHQGKFDELAKTNADEHAQFRKEIDELKAQIEAGKKPTEDEERKTAEEKEHEEVKDEISEEAAPEKKEEAGNARDSAYLEDSFKQTLADAEILVPGIVPPMTFDRAARPVRTYKDGICGMRRTALDMFYNTTDGRAFIDQQLAGRAFQVRDAKTMPCRRVTDMFRAAVAYKRTANNSKAGAGTSTARTGDQNRPAFGSTMVLSAEQLAQQAAAAWGQTSK